jgi:hypothetical protein
LRGQGTLWQKTGSIGQGDVYKRVGDVFTIEGAHVHEAHIVVSKQELVGFYLPVEKVFVAAGSRQAFFGD